MRRCVRVIYNIHTKLLKLGKALEWVPYLLRKCSDTKHEF